MVGFLALIMALKYSTMHVEQGKPISTIHLLSIIMGRGLGGLNPPKTSMYTVYTHICIQITFKPQRKHALEQVLMR